MADKINLLDLEVNIPPTNFDEYTTLLAAPPGFGKSEWCTKYDSPLILDWEEGTKGKVVYRVPCSTWSDVKNIVKQLCAEESLKQKFRNVAFDTVNYTLEACKQYVIQEYQNEHPEKNITTFNKIPYGGGWELLFKYFKGEINKLKRAGYGIVFVAHIKDKTFEKETESEHNKTVPDLTDKERNLISAMADFTLLGEFETKTIEPAVRNNADKIIKPAVTKTDRVLYLRVNEHAEGKFRWKDCPEKIPFDYDIFKEVFLNAVQNEITKGIEKFGLSSEDVERINKDILDKRQKEQKSSFETNKEEKTLEDLIEEIKELARVKRDEEGHSPRDVINPILGEKFPKNITTTEEANKILQELKNL